jgi:hypothetical protein
LYAFFFFFPSLPFLNFNLVASSQSPALILFSDLPNRHTNSTAIIHDSRSTPVRSAFTIL